MRIYIHKTNFVFILIVVQVSYYCNDDKFVGGVSERAIRLNHELSVPDPETRRMLSYLLHVPRGKSSRLRSSSDSSSDADQELVKEVFGILTKLVDTIAEAVNQYLEHQWLDSMRAFNRTLEDRATEKDSVEKRVEKAEKALKAMKEMVDLKHICRKKCLAWCSAMECQVPNCPEIPSDVNRCAGIPLCQPAWRCNLEIVVEEESKSKNRTRPKASNRLFGTKLREKHKKKKLAKKIKKAKKKEAKEMIKRIERSVGNNTGGKFPGTKKCYDNLEFLKLSKEKVDEFKRRVKELADMIKKDKDKKRVEAMCSLLDFYRETSKSGCDKNSFNDVIDGIPAIFYHTNLKIIDDMREQTNALDKYGFKRANCPPCQSTCERLMDLECSYTCPNRPGCSVFKCNCF